MWWMTVAMALEPWQVEQLAQAEARVAAQPGADLLQKALKAHGGLAPWIEAGSLAFDFDYAPLGAPEKRRYSRSQVDLRGRRAVQVELGEGADAKLGFDGRESWIVPTPESFPSTPSFWATTPFYFVGIPWVLADPGVNVAAEAPTVIPETGVEEPLPTFRVTFDSGTGDAPDDFYVVHLHPETHRILALRYIVTSKTVFPNGGQSPEKILLWSSFGESDGLLVARHYDSHVWSDGAVGAKKVVVEVDNVSLGKPLPDETFARPGL